jgi:4'-phosphopantetheinyl transferase
MEWSRFLAADELARADSFRLPRDARRFLASRGLQRVILASYARCPPDKLVFRYLEHGKPTLPEGSDLRFNLSNCDDIVLIAVTMGREIGADVERIRADLAVEEIARDYFSEVERESLASVPAAGRHRAFFQGWTRKEAFVKAKGDGLSLPLEQFDVSLAPGQPARLLATRPDPLEAARWELMAPDFDSDYAAAVITQTTPEPLRYWIADPGEALRPVG